jgi:iron complex transport system substrate-binding protein
VATPAGVPPLSSAHLHCPGDGRFPLKPLRACFAILLGACSAPPARPPAQLVVIDDTGDTLRLAQPASRIVSLSPSTTELVFALGAGDRLVGRTRWCDYPAAAAAVPNVGDGIPPNIEAVLARRPDLVLLYRSSQNAEAARQLRSAGIAVLTLRFDHLSDVSRLARLLGPLVGRAAAGDSLAQQFDAAFRRAQLRADSAPEASRPKVLILAWDQPPIAIGAGSFQSEILDLAGGRNIFEDLPTPSATVSIEAIAARDPDLILVGDTGNPPIVGRPEWRVVGAVKGGRFAHLAMPAFGRPGPRSLEVAESLRVALTKAGR